MYIGNNFLVGIPSAVWSAITRTLTGFGNAVGIIASDNQNIPANSTLNLSNPAGWVSFQQLQVVAGAAGGLVVAAGPTLRPQLLNLSATQSGSCLGMSTNVTYLQIGNADLTNVAKWASAGFQLIQ